MKPAAGLQFSEKGFVESQRLSDNGLEMGGGAEGMERRSFLKPGSMWFLLFPEKSSFTCVSINFLVNANSGPSSAAFTLSSPAGVESRVTWQEIQ